MPLALRNNGPIHPSASQSHAPMTSNGSFNPNAGLGIRANGMNSMMSPTPPVVGGAPGGGTPGPPNVTGYNAYYPDYMMGR